MTRLYGRKGFTTKKSVRRLLEPHEVSRRAGKRRVLIERVPAPVAFQLLGELPEAQRNDRARMGAPTFLELVDLGLSIPGAVLSGYRVKPEDLNERVTLTHLVIPNEVLDHHAVEKLASGIQDPMVIAVGADGSVFARWTAR